MSPFPARRGQPKKASEPKPKKVSVALINPMSIVGAPIYARLDRLIHLHHEELLRADTKIALMWNTSWEPDDDGLCQLGQCERTNDKLRELRDFDFIISLRKQTWEDIRTPNVMRDAILDHELCHAELKLKDGEVQEDERGRKVYRIRKHDIEEFGCIPRRYGLWTRNLEEFAAALEASALKSGGFIGPSALQRALLEAGTDLSLDVIATWTADEKREAYEWALLKRELAKRAADLPKDGTLTLLAPEFVSRALNAIDGGPALPLDGKDAAAGA